MPKQKMRPSRQARGRNIDQLLIDANSNTILMAALRGIYAGCWICIAILFPLLVVLTLNAANII